MLIDDIRNAGVVGAGGAGFPTHIKLAAKAGCFIVNAAECEPLIETDKYLCRVFAKKIISAARIVGEHLEATRIVVAVKSKYKREIAALKDAIDSDTGTAVELFLLDDFYPAGDEQVLVQVICGRSIPERGIPLAVGAVVDNVGTLISIYDAIERVPVTDKYLSVTGAVRKPLLFNVPIGTSVLECIEKADLEYQQYDIVLGGPMMGAVFTEYEQIKALSVTKTTGNILILPKGHHISVQAKRPLNAIVRQAQSACLQCRMCTDQCPRYQLGHQIRPHKVMRGIFLEHFIHEQKEYERMFGDAANCSECGLCEMYSCPMGLSPRKVNIFIKGRLRSKGIEVPKNLYPVAREARLSGKAGSMRLLGRLGLSRYTGKKPDGCITLVPDEVRLPLLQHIGKPAIPCKSQDDRVSKGELIAQAQESGLSANIHASIDGIIIKIDENCAIIKREGGSK